jgi:hypothetical protein
MTQSFINPSDALLHGQAAATVNTCKSTHPSSKWARTVAPHRWTSPDAKITRYILALSPLLSSDLQGLRRTQTPPNLIQMWTRGSLSKQTGEKERKSGGYPHMRRSQTEIDESIDIKATDARCLKLSFPYISAGQPGEGGGEPSSAFSERKKETLFLSLLLFLVVSSRSISQRARRF